MKELFVAGGLVMYPLLFLSVLSLATILQQAWFWTQLLAKENFHIQQILEAAAGDWQQARDLAAKCQDHPVGRFLYSALALENPDPDLLRLALESAADRELALMLRGEKVLEAVIAIAPLLGLLGTVTGLITSFSNITIGDVASNIQSGNLTKGIAEALISTAAGLIIAIFTLGFQRLFLAWHWEQVNIFRRSGNTLELIYRQRWLGGQGVEGG
ncbi:MAG: MotA/TolQ/ExbB proton channel family protein [Pseudanabaenaceae cyanobacterium SKYGB_i_bin29]|nr:MotA/TolQ/ExbB proton channel family protein [Pseudanabaenaceae cyanobacterium SKYG29]MDW8421123.1 MotA/TolQ/ExbB proton channel family protein [Pseudanabaenaceae cyanobacterium SKYGB_i_bin29]